jgi:hypothetical protein
LDIVPIKNEKREVVLFLASHKDITHTKMAELQICELYDSGEWWEWSLPFKIFSVLSETSCCTECTPLFPPAFFLILTELALNMKQRFQLNYTEKSGFPGKLNNATDV